MALDFPNSPTNGQIFTSGIKKWQWNTAEGSWLASNTSKDLYIWKNSAYTANVGDRIAADTEGGAFTLTLPSAVNEGWIQVVDAKKCWDQAGKNLTIARNGSTIEGLAEDLICNVAGDMVITLVYTGFTWRVYV